MELCDLTFSNLHLRGRNIVLIHKLETNIVSGRVGMLNCATAELSMRRRYHRRLFMQNIEKREETAMMAAVCLSASFPLSLPVNFSQTIDGIALKSNLRAADSFSASLFKFLWMKSWPHGETIIKDLCLFAPVPMQNSTSHI